jgi:TonB family protein
MIRSSIFAALVLSPLMVNAQASLPVQPQAATYAQSLHASLVQPKSLMLGAAVAEDRANATTGAVRISTGVVAPKLIHTVDVEANTVSAQSPNGTRAAVVLLTVDATGKPSDVKIVKSPGVGMDASILAAVRQFRFQPGTLDGQKAEIPVQLEITIQQAQ